MARIIKRISLFPFVVLAILSALSLFGSAKDVHDFSDEIACGYALAALDKPAPDVLIIGGSRVSRGIDPGYIRTRLTSTYNRDVEIERLSFIRTYLTHYRPVLTRMLKQRGAPKFVILQLAYNYQPELQHQADLPINQPANIVYASLSELAEIQFSAKLNDNQTVLPREFEAAYQSFPEVLLAKFENNIFSALRYMTKAARGKLQSCSEKDLKTQKTSYHIYNRLHDDLTYHPPKTEEEHAKQARDLDVAKDFLQPDLTSPYRRFQVDQLHSIIKTLDAAGSEVILMFLPGMGQREMDEETLDQIAQTFPDTPFIHPFALYQGELGEQLALSYEDATHASPFTALHFSRFLADHIAGLEF